MTQLNLPEPIAAYFDADKRGGDAIAHCFSKQAVVVDEGRTHTGRAAIEAWKASASTKYEYTVKPLHLERKNRRHIVTSRVSGNFPGSPVELDFVFELMRGKISYLEIAP